MNGSNVNIPIIDTNPIIIFSILLYEFENNINIIDIVSSICFFNLITFFLFENNEFGHGYLLLQLSEQ